MTQCNTGIQTPSYTGAFELFVKKGDLVFSVTVLGFPADQAKAKEATLAKKALAKL